MTKNTKTTEIEVYPIGTQIELYGEHDPIKGVISAICMRNTYVKYEIIHWVSKERKETWVEEQELIIPKGLKKIPIGFKS